MSRKENFVVCLKSGGLFPMKIRDLLLRKQGGSGKTCGVYSSKRSTFLMCLYVFSWRCSVSSHGGAYCPLWCSIRSVVHRIASHCGKQDERWWEFTSVVVMSVLSRRDFQIFESLLWTSPCSFYNTVDKAPLDVPSNQSQRCNAALYMKGQWWSFWCDIATSSLEAVSCYWKQIINGEVWSLSL